MAGNIFSFVIWSIIGLLFVFLGIYTFISKKAVCFWANAEMIQVTDIKKYNNAVGKLFCIFGLVFILLGIPFLFRMNSVLIIIPILGVVFESIAAMIIYSIVIEKKYKKK